MEFKLVGTLKDGNAFNYELTDAGRTIGLVQIRLKPSKSDDMPEDFESNAGYEILPEFQGKGFGKNRKLRKRIR